MYCPDDRHENKRLRRILYFRSSPLIFRSSLALLHGDIATGWWFLPVSTNPVTQEATRPDPARRTKLNMPHSTDVSTLAATITLLDEKLVDADADTPARFLHEQGITSETLPYWLVNVPRSQWTAECPAFLRDQPPKNVHCLATPDSHYKRQTWEQVQEIIS